MDIAYVFRHSEADDLELQYSLRSVAKCLPWVRKVFVCGDRPEFLSDDRAVIEHVPWEALALVCSPKPDPGVMRVLIAA